eukprot:2498202-Pyramimonas_sp.AAC.1
MRAGGRTNRVAQRWPAKPGSCGPSGSGKQLLQTHSCCVRGDVRFCESGMMRAANKDAGQANRCTANA